MVVVDKGIPIPARDGRGRRPRYPFATMEVGDSFLTDIRGQWAAANHKARFKSTGWNFTAQRQPGGSVRVWRTA